MMLVDSFRNGEFVGHSLLSFGLLPSGEPVMVDGQHRLEASILAGWEGEWLVRMDWDTPVSDLYVRLDSYQIRRTARVQGVAYQDRELGALMRQRGMEAARWQLRWSRGYSLPSGCSEAPVRDVRARMLARMDQLVLVDSLADAEGVSVRVYRKLALSAVLAVLVETLFVLPEEGLDFWNRVLRHQAGMSLELAQVLLEPVPSRQGSLYLPFMAAQAWNRRSRSSGRLHGESRSQLRLDGTELAVGKVFAVPDVRSARVGG